MKRHTSILLGIVLALSLPGFSSAQTASPREWNVDGVKRQALVFPPSTKSEKPAPVVFGFHGHGGTMGNAARSYNYQKLWPEAIVVYMQGLNTPGRLTDPEGKKPVGNPELVRRTTAISSSLTPCCLR